MASACTFILYDEFIGMRRVTEVRAAMADKDKRVSAQNSLGIPHDSTESGNPLWHFDYLRLSLCAPLVGYL